MGIQTTTPVSESGIAVFIPPPKSTATTMTSITTSITTTTTTTNINGDNIKIEIPPTTSHADEALIRALTGLVNRVYGESEKNVYKPGFERTTPDDIKAYLKAGQLAIGTAFPHPPLTSASTATPTPAATATTTPTPITSPATTQDDTQPPWPPTVLSTALSEVVAGCVLIRPLSPTTGDVAMLAVAPEWRGTGLGGRLMAFAEARCARDLGLRIARLEVLVPTHFNHSGKARLLAWYARRGYAATTLRDFAEAYPRLNVLLTGPTEYRVFEKVLVA